MVEDPIIRECVSAEDFLQCIALERAVFNDDDIDIMPIRLYMISKNCNAPTFGAFNPDGKILGFVHTSIALLDGKIVYHSHLAGVLEGMRHQDIGYRLKLAQREHAIRAGVPLIIWSFDPLQSRNAHFNINKLGAIIRHYKINYYGEGISTVFDAHLPSDRVIAEWWVKAPYVEKVLAGNRPRPETETARVEIPDNIDEVRSQSLDEHIGWRLRVRENFLKALEPAAIVRGFVREAERRHSDYLFGEDEEQFRYSTYQ
jgi:predicted GNAT superfamily acetyltransferase